MFLTNHDETARRRPPGRRRSGLVLTGTALGVVGVLFATTAASAAGLDTYPNDKAEAEASIIDMSLAGTDLFGLAQSHAGSTQNPGPNTEAFSGALGGTEIVDFGAGYQIPLDQFIRFGQLGVLQSRSTATDAKNAEAISGIVGADGGLTLDGTDSDFGEAQINLLSIPGTSAAAPAIDKADLSFALGGAWVKAIDGALQDPDGGVTGYGQYRAGSAKLVLHSPIIEQAAAGLSDAAGTLETSAVDTINQGLNLTQLASLVPGTTLTTSVSSTVKQDVLDAVMLAPIKTKDGYAEIDLGKGTITIDLGRLGSNDPSPNHPNGVIPNRPVGLNNQALGHGPHVLRGMEWYRGRLIAYSLGNFGGGGVFGKDPATRYGAYLSIRLRADGTVVAGRVRSVRFVYPDGTPLPDTAGGAARLMDQRGRRDFGGSAVTLAPDGRIALPSSGRTPR